MLRLKIHVKNIIRFVAITTSFPKILESRICCSNYPCGFRDNKKKHTAKQGMLGFSRIITNLSMLGSKTTMMEIHVSWVKDVRAYA